MIEDLRNKLNKTTNEVIDLFSDFIDDLCDVVVGGDIDKVAEFINNELDLNINIIGNKVNNNDVGIDALLARLEALESRSASVPTPKKALKKKVVSKRAAENTKASEIDIDFTVNNGNRRPKTKSVKGTGENLFEKLGLLNIPIDEEGYDKVNDKVARTPRNRDPHKDVDISCTECNKTCQVHPSLLKANYTCDNCLLKRVRV